MDRKEKRIEELLQTPVAACGCTIWGVQHQFNGRRSRLRVYIDKPGGVSVQDCEQVSREVGDVLDLEAVIAEGYDLEVSSPGLDRMLFNAEQYLSSIGEVVDVRLNFPFAGRKRFVGRLVDIEDGQAVVRVDDEEHLLPLDDIQRARVVPCFE